jgi:hypothetical protein
LFCCYGEKDVILRDCAKITFRINFYYFLWCNSNRWLAPYHNQKINLINDFVNLRENIDIPAYLVNDTDIDGFCENDKMNELGLRPFRLKIFPCMSVSCFVKEIDEE